ncbi:gluconokinase [Thioclava sp. BHET1]|nr:gluconokinase [Thioclava sp. BHET1]
MTSAYSLPPLLVMGVCGTGKTTIARAAAARMGGRFIDADDYHPPENLRHMSAGHPLSDDMRWGWLDLVAAAVAERQENGPVAFACSALKRSYRDRLRARLGEIAIVHLTGTRALIAARMAARPGHFMPLGLLDSQLADLQPPGPEEAPFIHDIAQPAEALSDSICREWQRLSRSGAATPNS